MRRTIDAALYYPALLVALTVPDICAALALDNNIFVKEKHYVDFVNTYTTEADLGLSGLDCYRLRGGVVHRASFAAHPKLGWTHVIFTIPTLDSVAIHAMSFQAGNKIAAMFDVTKFCRTMDLAARRWFSDHKDDPKVAENISNLIRFCPNGLAPFVDGFPVVASGA
jgi:hypothetical protein